MNRLPTLTNMRGRTSVGAFLRRYGGAVLTVVLLGAGCLALWRLLSPLHAADVAAQITGLGLPSLAVAAMATLAGYAALIGYDASALRYLDKRLPPLAVGLGGFLGYSIGNTIGLSVVSGGAIRYRIYAPFGLTPGEVLKIATFAAMSYGLGATVIGLAALIVQPGAIAGFTSLAAPPVRLLAAVGFIGVMSSLWALSRGGGVRRLWRWSFRAPSAGLIGRQIVLTGIELLMGAVVLFVLLPAGHGPFLGLVVLYAIATMVGILSHVPGGVGVFETVMLAGLPATVPVPALLGALLLFRIIYFLMPFCLALVVFAATQAARPRPHCETVTAPTGAIRRAAPSLQNRAANLRALQPKENTMKPMKMAALWAAMILGTGAAGVALAETETKDTAEAQQFMAHPQSLAQAITAAETSVGGKAMDAGWEVDGSTGGYHVEVLKTDGTVVDVKVAADGTTTLMPEALDGAGEGDQNGNNDNG